MKVKITIIGLGQIGTSIGLGLRNQREKVTRYGHDIDLMIARKSKKLDAVDKIFINLPSSVENANLIILALPFDQIYPTLQVIAPCLQENAVVMDTSPMKSSVAKWTKELFPPNRFYVGLFPSINPALDLETSRGIEGARSDLFDKSIMAITASKGTDGAALKLAADFTSILGAKPYFVDLQELDIINTYIHLLPQITTAAFVNTSMNTNAWNDAKKIAGPIFSKTINPIKTNDNVSAIIESSKQGKQNTIRVIDELISSLAEIKEAISSGKTKKLDHWLDRARDGQASWSEERKTGEWYSQKLYKSKFKFPGIGKRLFGELGKLFSPPKINPEKNDNDEKNEPD
jgi:prephenate dehydrogenase